MLVASASGIDRISVIGALLIIALAFSVVCGFAADAITTKPFTGTKVNGGTVTLTRNVDDTILTLSEDFVVPPTPDPHWQVVDSKGNVYLLQRLDIKGDKVNTSITLPSYVPDVVKVQIWCAYAETLLGEAPFERPVN